MTAADPSVGDSEASAVPSCVQHLKANTGSIIRTLEMSGGYEDRIRGIENCHRMMPLCYVAMRQVNEGLIKELSYVIKTFNFPSSVCAPVFRISINEHVEDRKLMAPGAAYGPLFSSWLKEINGLVHGLPQWSVKVVRSNSGCHLFEGISTSTDYLRAAEVSGVNMSECSDDNFVGPHSIVVIGRKADVRMGNFSLDTPWYARAMARPNINGTNSCGSSESIVSYDAKKVLVLFLLPIFPTAWKHLAAGELLPPEVREKATVQIKCRTRQNSAPNIHPQLLRSSRNSLCWAGFGECEEAILFVVLLCESDFFTSNSLRIVFVEQDKDRFDFGRYLFKRVVGEVWRRKHLDMEKMDEMFKWHNQNICQDGLLGNIQCSALYFQANAGPH